MAELPTPADPVPLRTLGIEVIRLPDDFRDILVELPQDLADVAALEAIGERP